MLFSLYTRRNFDIMSRYLKYVLFVQGVYYFLTGLWSLIDIDSFMIVTGHKTDTWLVKAMGFLFCAIGFTLFISVRESARFIPSVLALSVALLMAITEFYFFSKGTIHGAYAIDAIIQTCFVAGVSICWAPRDKQL